MGGGRDPKWRADMLCMDFMDRYHGLCMSRGHRGTHRQQGHAVSTTASTAASANGPSTHKAQTLDSRYALQLALREHQYLDPRPPARPAAPP